MLARVRRVFNRFNPPFISQVHTKVANRRRGMVQRGYRSGGHENASSNESVRKSAADVQTDAGSHNANEERRHKTDVRTEPPPESTTDARSNQTE